MVLFSIVGELGTGKTLALAYLSWTNWFKKERKVYSNFNLYGFPFTKIASVDDLDRMKQGFFVGDELWLWISSWAGRSKELEIISTILLKSRKRGLTIAFTAQSIHQINKRIRDVTDFVSYPMMSPDNSYTRLEVFRGPKPRIGSRIGPPLYFNNEPVFAIYNTYEEVKTIKESKDQFGERFLPIETNPAWVKYLHEERGFTREQIIKESRALQSALNPEGITSEKQRKRKADFTPI